MSGSRRQGSVPEQLDRRVVFPFSTGLLRVAAGAALLAVALGVIAALYLSRPKAPPAPPPAVAEPALPPKPVVRVADLGAAARPPARPQGTTTRIVPRGESEAAPSPDDAALEPHLARYRALAEQLRMPWESTRRQVCEVPYFGECLRWSSAVAQWGMSDVLQGTVLGEELDAREKDAVLTAAEALFAAIASEAGAPASVFDLRAPEPRTGRSASAATAGASLELDGPARFRAWFVTPAKALRTEFRKIQHSTPDSLPPHSRVTLAGDLYPGAVAIAKEVGGKPADRAKAVEQFAEAFTAMERARLASSADLVAEYRRSVRAREQRIEAAEAEHQAEIAERKARRAAVLYGIGVAAGAVISIGVLLALLAIERHLRVLRTLAVDGLYAPAHPARRDEDGAAPGLERVG